MISEFGKFGEFAFNTTPMAHQLKSFEETKDRPYYALFWEMGCAKTKVCIDTAAYLFLKGKIDGVLVISDKGAYGNWTNTEIPIHIPSNVPYRSLLWKSTVGKQYAELQQSFLTVKPDCLDFVAMNVEAFSRDKALIYAKEFIRNHYTLVIIDESDSIKSPKSKRTQAILTLRDVVEYRRILTGTPISNSPLDIYAQAEFLNRGLLGNSFTVFQAEYAHLMLTDTGRGKKYYTILGYKNLDQLRERIKPWSSSLFKKDCLDLPEKVYTTWHVEHTPEQAKMYKEIKELALTEYAGGLLTATSALTALIRLHQINCGHVKMDALSEDENGVVIDIPNNRVSTLIEILSKINGKVIIWACFKRDFELIGKALTEHFGKDSWVDYYGGTSEANRQIALERFLKQEHCRFFVSNPATGGRSLTLTVATYAIYYSYNWRLALRLQSEDRNHRKGQTKSCTYIDMCIPGTIDTKILKSHKDKKDIAHTILSDFKNIIEEETLL